MKKTILILAEESTYSSHVRQLLADYEIFQCVTVDDGVRLCRLHGISLVLIAENVRGSGGCELFNDLREQCPMASGLLLAGTEDNVLLRQAIDAGISGLVRIPLDSEQLLQRVSKAMESVILREENTRLHTLFPLYNLGEQFLSSANEQEVLATLLDEVVSLTGTGHVSVMLYDVEKSCLRIAAARGMDNDLMESICIQPGDQIAGWVFQEGKPVILNRETQQDSPFAPLLKRPEITSAISFPLIVRGNILGVLNISRMAEDVLFSEADKETLGIICGQAALALENVRSLEVARNTTRMRTLLEQYVAPEVAEILLASDADIMGLGAIKEVTVLFADIRNFTGLVQHLPLVDLRTFLNEFFQIFTDAIFQHRGTVDKFMGDAVLAVFGAPVELENANQAAVETALVIRDRFEELRLRWVARRDDFKDVDLGIAVTCGQMYLGNVGSTRRLDYTVIGTPVNIAQRLAAESYRCRIYVTAAVERELGSEYETDEVGDVSLRGVEQDVKVFSVR
jgi:adenylate cyclase